jgi:LuxR family maltose regulon positive regulatory protein
MNSGEASILKTIYGFRGKLNRFDEFGTLVVEKLPCLIGNFSAYFIVGLAECQYERNNLQAAYQVLVQGMETIMALNNPGAMVPVCSPWPGLKWRTKRGFD